MSVCPSNQTIQNISYRQSLTDQIKSLLVIERVAIVNAISWSLALTKRSKPMRVINYFALLYSTIPPLTQV